MSPDISMLKDALRYATRFGWQVYPLKPGTIWPYQGADMHNATNDPEQLRIWWTQWPNANIGLHCGPSGVVAVDPNLHIKDDAGDERIALEQRQTTTGETGNGSQYLLYQMPEDEWSDNSSGIELNGSSSILLPPSIHPPGHPCRWAAGYAPDQVPPQPLPEKLFTILKTVRPKTNAVVRISRLDDPRPDLSRWNLPEQIQILICTPSATEGRRQADKTVISTLVRAGASDDDIRAIFDCYPIGQQGKYAEMGLIGEQYLTQAIASARQQVHNGAGQPISIESHSDLGNARRLVREFGKDLHYCQPWKQWLVWDGTRWAIDSTGEIVRRAMAVIPSIYAEAAQIQNLALAAIYFKWAHTSESLARLNAMINLARSQPEIPVEPNELDVDPWLLNVQNGTLDLTTGKLRRPHRQDLITNLAPVAYDPDAQCPIWLRFLDRIMDHNQNLIAFLQRVLGYALTGDTSEQVLFFCYGTGANGKSTLFNTIRSILGPGYARHTPTETLLVKRSGGVGDDLVRLMGARFVTAVEAGQGRRLDETQVKQLTGGDPIAGRPLYGKYVEFTPSAKLFFGGNEKPGILGTDYAMWRRMLLIPFTVTITEEEQDKTLPDLLKEELPGILAWCVRGCLLWQAEGLAVPDEVKTATADYRDEMDVFGAFLKDCCVEQHNALVTSADLYSAYKRWCADNSERPLRRQDFGQRLKRRGFEPARIGAKGTRAWRGLRLRGQTDIA